ncbi:MAG TPA: polysaccharide biosynthesis/export family protein [Chitinophagaceae bacterium]|nr:polysaccharide biosynthesis/export family protein [Chitinophagaceae bacterium]HRF19098.1 polysaccharide biosynthesis/export family protein [Chitinophagaceae bacterium]
MRFSRLFLLIVVPLYLISCKPVQQLPYYLEKVNDSTGKGEVKVPELRIQKNDLLSIQISSLSTKPELSDAIYNQVSAAGSTSAGYLVDAQGNIEHHRLGVIHAEGLTKQELAAEIKKRLTVPVELLKDPTVIIRFMNFKVTVLGQVGQQGPVTVPGERLTVLEAIGLAGGITDYGKKDKVKVVREINGQRETGIIDLSSKDIFDSPYYNLVQNDLLIVGETNEKMKDAQQAKVMQRISFAFTIVTVAATLTNIFIRN